MGFVIKTAEERNPTNGGQSVEQTRIQELESEIQRHNDFLEENGLSIKFDMWVDIKDGIAENVKAIHEAEARERGEEVDFEEIN